MVEDGIFFFVEKSSSGSSFLSFHSFASGKVEPVVEVARPFPDSERDAGWPLRSSRRWIMRDMISILLENFHGIGEGRESKQGAAVLYKRKETRSKQRDSMSGR